jgi:hypothetical protein
MVEEQRYQKWRREDLEEEARIARASSFAAW